MKQWFEAIEPSSLTADCAVCGHICHADYALVNGYDTTNEKLVGYYVCMLCVETVEDLIPMKQRVIMEDNYSFEDYRNYLKRK